MFKEKETQLLAEMELMSDKSQFVKSNVDFSLVESLKTRCEDLEKQINMKTSEINSVKCLCNWYIYFFVINIINTFLFQLASL